jgi:predicted dinucleotide-binding enzyme
MPFGGWILIRETTMTTKFKRREFLLTTAAGLVVGVMPASVLAQSGGLKIGTIGSGRIGATLGELWLKAGHEVMFSSLDLEQDKALAAKLGGKARAGTSKEAVSFGDVILLAVPYGAMPAVSKDVGSLIKGKVVIDASNPITGRDGEVGAKARETGVGTATAQYLPGARVVRAFNAIGYARLTSFAQNKGAVGMPIAADDKAAIEIASRLIREVGLEPVVIGPLAMGKHLVPGTALGGERSPDEIRKIAATLN